LDTVCKSYKRSKFFLDRCSWNCSSIYVHIDIRVVHKVMMEVLSRVQFGMPKYLLPLYKSCKGLNPLWFTQVTIFWSLFLFFELHVFKFRDFLIKKIFLKNRLHYESNGNNFIKFRIELHLVEFFKFEWCSIVHNSFLGVCFGYELKVKQPMQLLPTSKNPNPMTSRLKTSVPVLVFLTN